MPALEFVDSDQPVSATVTAHWEVAAFDANYLIATAFFQGLGQYAQSFQIDAAGVFVATGQVELDSGASQSHGDVVTLDSTKAVAVWWQGSNLLAVVITRSGVTLTDHAVDVVTTSSIGHAALCRLSSTKALLVYWDSATVRAVVLDVSGTTVTHGTPVTVATGITTGGVDVATIDSTHAVCFYPPSARVLTVSGTSITVEAATTVCAATETAMGVTVPTSTLAVTHHRDSATGKSKVSKLSISGATLAVTGSVVSSEPAITDAASYGSIDYFTDGFVFISFRQVDDVRWHVDLFNVTGTNPAFVVTIEVGSSVDYPHAGRISDTFGWGMIREASTATGWTFRRRGDFPPRIRGRHTAAPARIRGRHLDGPVRVRGRPAR